MINFNIAKNQILIHSTNPIQKKRVGLVLTPLKQDTLTFSGKRQTIDFNDFNIKFRNLSISNTEFINKCLSQKALGEGEKGKVYKIPIASLEDYVLKAPKDYTPTTIPNIAEVNDDFPNNNFGQPIAKMGEYLLLKKVNGVPLCELRKQNPINYYKQLSQMPQKAYNDLIKDITETHKKGYHFDGNGGNVLLDTKNQKFSIIDLAPDTPWNYIGECLYPFIGRVKTEETFENKKIVIAKIFKSAKKYDIDYGMNDQHLSILYKREDTPTKKYLDTLLDSYLNLDEDNFNKFINKYLIKE